MGRGFVRGRLVLATAVASGALLVSACSVAGGDRGSAEPTSAPRPTAGAGSDTRTGAATAELPRATPRSQGFTTRELDQAARAARRAGSSCFAVLRRGKVVTERSWRIPEDQPREAFSITKSVTSALVGIAVRDGDLRLTDPVSSYVPQWRGTPSETVTVRHLLSNTSGRFWSMQSDYGDLVQAPSRTRYAIRLTQQFPPGTSWQYNNAAIQVLEQVLERATGMPVSKLAEERLFEPLGMEHSFLTSDRNDDAAAFFGLQTTCLDIARFGLLYLNGGTFRGERILPKSYVEQSVGHSSSQLNAAYGLLWWVNRPGIIRGATDELDPTGQPLASRSGQLLPGLSQRVFGALGLGGQVLLVDPTTRTIVVRQGNLGQGANPYSFADAAAVLP